MRKNGLRALLLILLSQGILLGWAAMCGGKPIETGLGFAIKYPSLTDILSFTPVLPTEADSLLDALADSTQLAVNLKYDPARDTDSPYADTTSIDYTIRIENPLDAGATPLDAFFGQLVSLQDSAATLVRIAHYGDSQIEGDRISQFLRTKFQADFGGNGLGLLPIIEPTSNYNLLRSCSPNWVRHTVFQNKTGGGDYNWGGTLFRYGVGLIAHPNPKFKKKSLAKADSTVKDSASSAAPPLPPSDAEASEEDTSGNEEPEFFYTSTGRMEAEIVINLRRTITYSQVKMLWGGSAPATGVKTYHAGKVVWEDSLRGDGKLHTTQIPIPAGASQLRIRFDGPSPDVYGLLVDPMRGIQVDNLAIRGHSGNELTRINDNLLAQQLKLFNTRLIVLQYGGNMVPWKVDGYKWLEDDLYKNLVRFKKLAPHASILVVGVADMAHKVDGHYQSYASVEQIRAAQQRAAEKAGVAFWDLYKVMGGRGSIISWVNRKPALAAQDYAHFSPYGQKLLGDLLYKALMNEYRLYQKRQTYIQNQLQARRDSATAAKAPKEPQTP